MKLSVHHRNLSRRRGVGLIELMLSLSISAMLLAAVAAAYTATATGIEHNDQFFRASQAARVSINQIMSEVRKCQSGVVESTALEITADQGQKRRYEFHSEAGQLIMRFPESLDTNTYVLARNVQSAQFHTNGNSISLILTVKVGRNSVTLSGSGMPRRAMSFQ